MSDENGRTARREHVLPLHEVVESLSANSVPQAIPLLHDATARAAVAAKLAREILQTLPPMGVMTLNVNPANPSAAWSALLIEEILLADKRLSKVAFKSGYGIVRTAEIAGLLRAHPEMQVLVGTGHVENLGGGL